MLPFSFLDSARAVPATGRQEELHYSDVMGLGATAILEDFAGTGAWLPRAAVWQDNRKAKVAEGLESVFATSRSSPNRVIHK